MNLKFGPGWRRCRLHAVPVGLSRWLAAVVCLTGFMAGTSVAHAGPVLDRIKASGAVRVCIWPDYYGVTHRSPRNGMLSGIDIELSAAFAQELGVKLQYVETTFADLVKDLTREHCDVAMFAVGVTEQRKQALSFSAPYLKSDIYGVTTRTNRTLKNWEDIDRPGVNVAVQAGTFMESVMAGALKQARMVVIRPPQSREKELEAGRVDVFMTDYPYSRRLLDNADWARLLSPGKPFFELPYAYAIKPGDEDLMRELNLFVARIKSDGRLDAAAKNYGLTDIVVRR